MVFLITDIDESQAVCGYAPRVVESTICPSFGTEGPEKAARRIEQLDAVVVAVWHDELANPIHRDSRRAVEFPFVAAVRSKLE